MKSAGPPCTFLKDGRLIKKPLELANIQLEHFSSKISQLMERLANQPSPPRNPLNYLEEALQRWILILISKLGNTTACGLDEIDAQTIKLAAENLIMPIKHLVNTSLREARFANKWKIAKTIPILKDKDLDKTSPNSYRPVALLSTISKVVERMAQLKLMDHLETTGQLNPNSHAYRQGLNTTSTLMQITDGLYMAAENKQISSLMATDKSAAFDCVRHSLLLQKLKLYKLDDNSLSWIEDYLSYRSHYVCIGRAATYMKSVTRGVPPGLSPGATPLLHLYK